MPKSPPTPPQGEEVQYTPCPYCTIAIPSKVSECPHCRQKLSSRREGAPAPPPPRPGKTRPGQAPGLWEKHGRWIRIAGPAVLVLAAALFLYSRWVGTRLTIESAPSLPVKASLEKEGEAIALRGSVTNEGEDIPDFSLKSVGVVVEFVYRNGRRQKKTIFPKAEYRGEGALLRGETGSFEIFIPKAGLVEVTLRSEVVDLGRGR